MPDRAENLIEVRRLQKFFAIREGSVLPRHRHLRAVDDVSLDIRRGEVLAIVGESGSGKSTLGRLILHLLRPTAGQVRFDGVDLATLGRTAMRRLRRRMQIVFQDPFSSLNPHMTIGEAIAEVLDVHGMVKGAAARSQRTGELLRNVGLPQSAAHRYPHEFSGGQRQRIGIARAIAAGPEFVVADEPVSALDVSIQAQILNLLADLRAEMGLTMLFISHDLAVVRHIADRVAVMYLGKVMEVAPAAELFEAPLHPYTEALLSAAPRPGHRGAHGRIILKGDIPSPMSPPSGCVFRTRCPYAVTRCAEAAPALAAVGATRGKACIRDDLTLVGA
jgi:oligopeptide/dipeptide ABC transporter ATP-binding protein